MSLESALQSFSTQPLLAAARSLFKDTLNIPLSPLADTPIPPKRFFRDAYKPERHDAFVNLFLAGTASAASKQPPFFLSQNADSLVA